jgi:alpha-1,3-glucosyltransferase
MFGWHVHEKAVLLVLVPFRFASCLLQVSRPFSPFIFSLLAADNHAYFRTFTIASIAGIYSLFPLLFTPAGESRFYCRIFLLTSVTETPIKLIYPLLWAALVILPLSKRVYEYAIPEIHSPEHRAEFVLGFRPHSFG